MDARPGIASLRNGRTSLPRQLYLVTAVTHLREPRFDHWLHATAAARALTSRLLWRGSRLLCWCLMPDHWHALVELGEADSLPGLLNRLQSASARSVNSASGRGGRVWQRGFHDHGLRAEEDVAGVARYIVANPVRAGLVGSVREWAYWDAVWLAEDRVCCSVPEGRFGEALSSDASGDAREGSVAVATVGAG